MNLDQPPDALQRDLLKEYEAIIADLTRDRDLTERCYQACKRYSDERDHDRLAEIARLKEEIERLTEHLERAEEHALRLAVRENEALDQLEERIMRLEEHLEAKPTDVHHHSYRAIVQPEPSCTHSFTVTLEPLTNS